MSIAVAIFLLAPALCAGAAEQSATVGVGVTAAHGRQLSAADDRKEIHVQVGETVMVAMHEADYNWKLRSTNPAILAPMPGVKLKAGIVGVIRAKAPGSATITLEGSPKCAPGYACAQFLRSVIFPVVVDT